MSLKKMMCDYLFVYGTLRQDSHSEMYRLLARYANFLGNATYQGKLYIVDYYPGVVRSDNPKNAVFGEVYQLMSADTVLSQLDDYEACGIGFPEPTEYLRCKEHVTLKSGEIIAAWIYIFNRTTEGLRFIESGDFCKR
jgi:gamma-glutamylcyclotransferase (GGCT)/AIG2-like uncharacterized protein YtfP